MYVKRPARVWALRAAWGLRLDSLEAEVGIVELSLDLLEPGRVTRQVDQPRGGGGGRERAEQEGSPRHGWTTSATGKGCAEIHLNAKT